MTQPDCMLDKIGTVRKRHNAVGVKVIGGWTVVWTLFTDGTAQRGYFYSDGSATAAYIVEGELVADPSTSEVAFEQRDPARGAVRQQSQMSDHACPVCGYIHPNMDDPAEQVRALSSSDITSRIHAAYEGYFPEQQL